MIPRFVVKTEDNGLSYYVRDNMANTYGLPVKAVTMYFVNQMDAIQIADIMNKEWMRFLRNPS